MRSEKNSYLWKVPTFLRVGMRQDWNLLVIILIHTLPTSKHKLAIE